MANEALTKAAEQALARPDFLKDNRSQQGTEHITRDDMQIPRIALAQGISPEMSPSNDRYIDGLRIGDLFNTVTRQIYGRELLFTALRGDQPRWIEYVPRKEGGGVKDFNVEPGDPRTEFRTGDDGKRLPPIATQYRDFLVMLHPLQVDDLSSMIALSFKSTGLKVAKRLNSLIKYRNAPIYAGKYLLTTGMDKNSEGEFAVYKVANAGWVSQEEFEALAQIYADVQGIDTTRIDRGDNEHPEDAGEPQVDAEGNPIPF
jgi:hypothetical protein